MTVHSTQPLGCSPRFLFFSFLLISLTISQHSLKSVIVVFVNFALTVKLLLSSPLVCCLR